MRKTAVFLFMVLAAAWGGVHAAEAQTDGELLSPYFFVESDGEGQEHFPLKSTAVEAAISGVVADVTVTQTYANTGTGPINARYVFPAGTRAAVHGMRMTVGEEVIEARIKAREEARKTFADAKTEGKRASLLEQQRPNVFSMDVANIMPGETIAVELHYSELLVPEEGMYQFVFPTVVGPRYSTIPAAGADDHHQWLRNPYLTEGRESTSTFDIQVTLAGGLPIQQVACPSHATDVAWAGPSQAHITLASGESHGGNRDFILDYRLSGDRIHSGLMLYEGETENFFMLMVQPPVRVVPEAMPPREYIFVLDVSGSMRGFPLDTAKLLMKDLLDGLRPEDRFNVILFAGAARIFAPRSVAADPVQIQAAVQFIDNQQGGGGTELARALETGLALPHDDGQARTMVVVTDGYIAAEKTVFGLIADQVGRCNLFAFGIGSSVNRHLIEGLACAGQGEPFMVTEPQNAAAVAARFRRYIEAPLLTDIKIDMDGFDAYDVEPLQQADLFAQRPLIVSGKWRGVPSGTIVVRGTTGDGPHAESFDVSAAMPSDDNRALPFLWARRRLQRLSDFSADEDDEAIQGQVTRIGLTYKMLTAHTSFVAVHERVHNTAAPARDVTQPLPLPLHVSNLAVGARNVPEPGLGLMLAAALLPGLWLVWRRRRSGDHR
ncbi:inter-alpha-trypsin inhibitor domain-containing protein [Desulfosarcina ovata subsp. sediminis]|uniref:Inter-alpha-trypsin inhibitor domain-containing protein n=1 Tax=Desulfosarcina ovata subsp. sediminis TaxID=885957 RepID=A0A5K7ZVG8_9BACT|nr:VIT domain-containing protein [Desulfosarcina ovata]BBO84245.1 inter-alpha-trypsin inhibitor domain-containing protein [Desulfosarcina ovata subsp. sediminis]